MVRAECARQEGSIRVINNDYRHFCHHPSDRHIEERTRQGCFACHDDVNLALFECHPITLTFLVDIRLEQHVQRKIEKRHPSRRLFDETILVQFAPGTGDDDFMIPFDQPQAHPESAFVHTNQGITTGAANAVGNE